MNDRDARVALAGAVAALAVQEKWTAEYTDRVDRAALGALTQAHIRSATAADLFRAIVAARAQLARGARMTAPEPTLAGLEAD